MRLMPRQIRYDDILHVTRFAGSERTYYLQECSCKDWTLQEQRVGIKEGLVHLSVRFR